MSVQGDSLKARTREIRSSARRPDHWRHDNVGRLLNNAIRRFEARVLELMADAGHSETRISHVSLTRNLDRGGTRITELAQRAGMTKQGMGELVQQCVSLRLVECLPDPNDGRARLVRFTRRGISWLDAFREAVDQAEHEMLSAVGERNMKQTRAALARYGAEFDPLSST